MADKVVGGPQADDLFAMNANFHCQSSSDNDMADVARVWTNNGSNGCSSVFNNRNERSCEYLYCGTNIVGDFGTHLSTFGALANSNIITQITVRFSAGSQPSVTVSGHNHDSNAHAASVGTSDVSSVIPASSGNGVAIPNIWTNGAGTTSSVIEVDITFSFDHIDTIGEDGEHVAGANIRPRAEVTARYIGVPSLTTTGWEVLEEDSTTSSEDFDGYTIRAEKGFAMI